MAIKPVSSKILWKIRFWKIRFRETPENERIFQNFAKYRETPDILENSFFQII